jgi:hypothetical protein
MKKNIPVLPLLAILLLFAGTAYGAGKQAIMMGIDEYPDESQIAPLTSAASDVQALSRILSGNGYECQTLLNQEAAKAKLGDVFIRLEQQTMRDGELDVFLFYFSGRGTRVPDDIRADETQDGMDECILPSDASAGNSRTFIRDDDLARWINAVQAKQTIVIVDCAFWGDENDPTVKGIGEKPTDATVEHAASLFVDGIEITDGLPANAVIISAGSPRDEIRDGIFTAKMLEACVAEEADKDGGRVISFAEAYEYARDQLQGKQSPGLVGMEQAILPFAPLPPLSTLSIGSDPPGAEIEIYLDSEKVSLKAETPATVPLRKGNYSVKVQKSGYLISRSEEVTIDKYDNSYEMEPFQLKPVTLIGQVKAINSAGEATSVDDGILSIHVSKAGEGIFTEALPADGSFQFSPGTNPWLEIGSEYQVSVSGKPVLASETGTFTYSGYEDIQVSIQVTLDDVPPALAPDGVTLESTRLVAGDQMCGVIKARDQGLGLADTADVKFQPPGEQEPTSASASQAPGSEGAPPAAYRFCYTLPEEARLAGEWRISSLTLHDKAGNTTIVPADQIKETFTVFASRYALGKYYFDAKDYTEALSQLNQVSPTTDDALYLAALSQYHLNDADQAIETFMKIDAGTAYAGKERREDMPQMPRPMANKLWGELLKNFPDHRDDPDYLELMAAVAEELGRDYDAKIYRENARKLRDVKRKE